MTQLTQDSRRWKLVYGDRRSAVSLVKRGDVDGRRDLFTVLIRGCTYTKLWKAVYSEYYICCLLYASYTSTQYYEEKKKKKGTSCKKLQLADSLRSQSPHLWGLLQVHTDVPLLRSCSQPVAEHGWDTSAGPVLPRAAWPRQSCTAAKALPSSLLSWCQCQTCTVVWGSFFFFSL